MKNSIRILGIGMSLILASSCCLASQGATLEKGIDVGNYMTIQTEQKSKRFEISTSKFAEMKQNAKARETSDLALSREIVRQAGLSQGEELVSHQLADHLSEIGCLRYPTLPQDFSVYLRYAHLQYALTNSVSFGWSSGDQPGVTMETGITSEEKYYTFHIPFYGYTP